MRSYSGRMVDPSPSGEEIAARLRQLRHAIDEMEVEFARLAVDFDRTSWWDYEGFNTAGDWIRFNCHMNSHTVLSAFAVGASLGEMPATMQAMSAGHIGFAHVATMARTAIDVRGAFDENALLPLAKEHSPGKFFHKCVHYRHSVDAEGYNRDQEQLAEERGLRLNTAQDGCLLISGLLDPVGGATVRASLEPLARPSGDHDDRSTQQRFGDALVEVCSGGKPASVQVTASIETLRNLPGAPAGEAEFSVPVSSRTARRMACDSTVARVVLGQESLVIDVGRSRRVVDGALRKALALRDKHCQWPACERPASWCDGHHLAHWIDGGETNLENCLLLCKRHHRMVHEGGWQLVKTDEGEIVTVAPTITFGVAHGPD